MLTTSQTTLLTTLQASAVGKRHIETEHEAGRGKDLYDTVNISDNEVRSVSIASA